MSHLTSRTTRMALGVLVPFAILGSGPDARAALSATRTWGLNATAACEPFQPTTATRLGVDGLHNKGTSSIYAACSMPAEHLQQADGGTVKAGIVVRNTGKAGASVTCTFRPGLSEGAVGNTEGGSYPRSVVVAAGAQHDFAFAAASGRYFSIPNFSCRLPPGVEISHVYRVFRENIGT